MHITARSLFTDALVRNVGVAFWGGMTAAEIVECARLAEKLGLSSVWMNEGHGGDAFSVMSGCAVATRTIGLGTCIVSVYVRSAPTIALGAATVDALSNGRFILGLGSSHRVQVLGEHGLSYEKPMQRVQETVDIVRGLLKEGKVTHRGEIFTDLTYDLWFNPVRKAIPVYISALFPKMLSLCGRIADGLVLSWNSVERARESARIARDAAERVGKPASKFGVACIILTCISDDEDTALSAVKETIAFYAGFFPRYNRLLAESGFEVDTQNIKDAYRSGGTNEAVKVVSDRMARELAIVGTTEECLRRLEEYQRAGTTLPLLFPIPPSSKAERKDAAKSAVIRAIEAYSKYSSE